MIKNLLCVLAAPSGAGKTTVAEHVVAKDKGIIRSISCTTRPKRESEVDGQAYKFLDQEAFASKVEKGDFIEHAQIYGYSYGTERSFIEGSFAKSKDVLLVVDWQGAESIRRYDKNAVCIFLLPPSYDKLVSRINKRGQDSKEVIQRRIGSCGGELDHYLDFKYLLVNDSIEKSCVDIMSIINAERMKTFRQVGKIDAMLHKLLKDAKKAGNC